MRFLRLTLLQAYLSNIQQNKKKALLLINTGIFLSIFAVSSAIISFFIERDISKKQSEILEHQISIKEGSTMITSFETLFNQYSILVESEDNNRVDKQFFSETKLGNKVLSANDYYLPFLQFAAREIEDIERVVSFENDNESVSFNIRDLFDINHEFNQSILEMINGVWSKEEVESFTNSIIKVGNKFKKIEKINFENYEFKSFQTLDEIILELKHYKSYHVNRSGSKMIDDYFAIIEFDYAFVDWASEFLNLMKSTYAAEEDVLKEINEEIIILSKREKNIILITFLFQFIVFFIIQIFEVNSLNFNLKRKLS